MEPPPPSTVNGFLLRLSPGGARRYKTGQEKPWEITAAPIVVAVIFDSVIPDSMGENWQEGQREGGSAPIVGGEGYREYKMTISEHH